MNDEQQMKLAHERNLLAKHRTRLANKRTFLAWCRTALAFMGFGFLLEKVDAFLLTQHGAESVLGRELGMLGGFAFVCGPLLILFAGWRYAILEKEMGTPQGHWFMIPEAILFVVILLGALIYYFL